VLGRHATGDGPSIVSAGGIRGTRAEGKEIDWGFERGLNELSGKVLKTHVIY
jgi:hypothetical protein